MTSGREGTPRQEEQEFHFNLLVALFMIYIYFAMASFFESLAYPFAI